MKRLFCLVLLIFSLGACKEEAQSVVLVSVTTDDGIAAIHQLKVTLKNSGKLDTTFFPKEWSQKPIDFPATFAVTLDRSHTGFLEIDVSGMDSGGSAVGNGNGSISIVVGGQASRSVNLTKSVTSAGTDGAVDTRPLTPDGGVLKDTSDSTVNTEDPCTKAAAICQRINSCAPFGVQSVYGDLQTCIERVTLNCNISFRSQNSGLTPTALTACLQALNSATCGQLFESDIPACNYTGERANGEACGVDDQCKSGHCALGDDQCGVCADRLKAGSTCISDDDCQIGLACNKSKKCVVRSNGGSACSDSQPCKWGYYCREGTCAASITQGGGTCDALNSCDLFQGLFCNTLVGRCQSVKVAKPGSSCGVMGGELVECAAGNCLPSGSSLTLFCSPFAKDGEPCENVTESFGCMDPARCVAGRCKLPNPAACR